MPETETPTETEFPPPLNDGFDHPKIIDDAFMAFPASLRVNGLIPLWEEIPVEFRSSNNLTTWNDFVSIWFFKGWPGDLFEVYSRSDIDPELAMRHLTAILKSFEPKHEHKEAACAWLMSRWFADVQVKG